MSQNKWTDKSDLLLTEGSNLGRYNLWTVSLFQSYLKGKILEVGSGQGSLSGLLPQDDLTLSDIQTKYVAQLKTISSRPVIKLDIESESPEILRKRFDTIFSSNVFEHIENDKEAFNNSYKLLKTGGYLLLFVPARMEIFGVLDEYVGHFRRYTKDELESKAKEAGFEIIEIKYCNFPGYFAWWGRGRLLNKIIRTKKKNAIADNLMAKMFDVAITPLLKLEKYFNLPFGQSLMLVAVRSE